MARLGLTQTPASYDSDSVWSYEIGSKNKLFNNSLQLSASAYHIDWKGIQRQVSLQCGFFYIGNVGSATSKGFDLQLDWRPVPALTLSAVVAHNDASYSEPAFGGVINAVTGERAVIVSEGDKLPVAPWTLSLSAQYHFQIRSSDAYIRTDYDYQSSFQAVPLPPAVSYDPVLERSPETHFVSARAGINIGAWDLSIFADNVTGSTDIIRRAHQRPASPLITHITFRPRTFGLSAAYRY